MHSCSLSTIERVSKAREGTNENSFVKIYWKWHRPYAIMPHNHSASINNTDLALSIYCVHREMIKKYPKQRGTQRTLQRWRIEKMTIIRKAVIISWIKKMMIMCIIWDLWTWKIWNKLRGKYQVALQLKGQEWLILSHGMNCLEKEELERNNSSHTSYNVVSHDLVSLEMILFNPTWKDVQIHFTSDFLHSCRFIFSWYFDCTRGIILPIKIHKKATIKLGISGETLIFIISHMPSLRLVWVEVFNYIFLTYCYFLLRGAILPKQRTLVIHFFYTYFKSNAFVFIVYFAMVVCQAYISEKWLNRLKLESHLSLWFLSFRNFIGPPYDKVEFKRKNFVWKY